MRLPSGHTVWNDCGVLFINRNDAGEISYVQVRHDMFPNVDMVAFPKREDNQG